MQLKRCISTWWIFCTMASLTPALADEPADTTSMDLDEVVITASRGPLRMSGAFNGQIITTAELRRAACCNLGESFTTNPSVDVNYSDAATGARQIRLLGLSGNYVQMLTENVPNFRGAAAPYGLGYVAGPWMQSIQVSKGASSVKNGYEAITGQINVEMKKPQADPSLSVNAYYDMMNKLEVNADGNLHFGPNWSAGLLTHFENGFSAHDSNNDGFTDTPRIRQFAIMPRVAYMGQSYVFQAAVKYLDERRKSGQHEGHGAIMDSGHPLYRIDIDTRRLEVLTKNAYIFDHENDGNVALIASASSHSQDAVYGHRICNIDQREAYASLMFERKWNSIHALSTGLSLNFDDLHYRYRLASDASMPLNRSVDTETVGGAYAQYTFNLDDRLIVMAGLRYDYSNRYGLMVTPRMHVRYRPIEALSIHASAGKGYHSPHPLAEYSYLMASSRAIIINPALKRESAINAGFGATYDFTIADRKISIDGEYYHTRFGNQLMVNLDRDPHAAYIYSSADRSYSNAVQFSVTASPISDLTLSVAWRLTDVKSRYLDGALMQKPLMSRNKGLLTIGYSPMMGLWQFDLSLALNGSGRMPTPYTLSDGALSWSPTFKPYTQLNAQVTRNFRHWAVYVGGENLTNFRQPNPIVAASDPWSDNFDATMVYGSLHGAMVYVGFRYNITKYL